MSTTTIKTDNVSAFKRIESPSRRDVMRGLIRLRWIARRNHTATDVLLLAKRQLKRAIKRWESNAFMAHRIQQAEAQITAVDADLEILRDELRQLAECLRMTAPFADALLTLSDRCDALNINTVDRADLGGRAGLIDLVFLHALEDSASRRNQEWNDAPLFNVAHMMFMDFLCNTPEGQAVGDSLFEPGELFEGVPAYRQAADGAMVRMPPRLRVVRTAKEKQP